MSQKYNDEFGYDFESMPYKESQKDTELDQNADRWLAALRKLVEDAMSSNMPIDPSVVELGKYLRKKTGAPDL